MIDPRLGRRCLPTLVSSLLLVCCGPTLKAGEKFTPQRVRALMFDDECQLQSYHDANPGSYDQRSDYNIGAEGHRTAGTAVYQLKPGPQTQVFADLVERLYERVPPMPRDQPLLITVDYQETKGHRTLPINAVTSAELPSGKDLRLPYHPCLGAYIFGARHYAARRAMLDPTPATQPAPTQ